MTFFELTIVVLIIVNSLMILILTFKVSSLPDNSIMKKWSEALESRLSRIWNNEDKLYREISNTHYEIKKQNDESGILLDRIDLTNGNVKDLHKKLVEILKYVEAMDGTIKFLQDYMKGIDNLEKSLNTTNKNINDSFDKFSKAFVVLSDDNKRTEETLRNEISTLYSRLLELIDKISTGDSKDFIEVESLKNEINQYKESIEKGNEVIQQLENDNKQYLSRIQQLENETDNKNSEISSYIDRIKQLNRTIESLQESKEENEKSHNQYNSLKSNNEYVEPLPHPPLSYERKKRLAIEARIAVLKHDYDIANRLIGVNKHQCINEIALLESELYRI